jgi:mannose/fructose/N-acetylgalactosamine-specific phosphotransferase system component IID
MSSAPQPGDKSAGFSGLILGAIVLFVVLFGIVRMTNAKYSGEHGEKAGAEATK